MNESARTKKAAVIIPHDLDDRDHITSVKAKMEELVEKEGAIIVNDFQELKQRKDAQYVILNPINKSNRASWHRLVNMISDATLYGFDVVFVYQTQMC